MKIFEDYHEAWKAFNTKKIKINIPFRVIYYDCLAMFVKVEKYEINVIGLPIKYRIKEVK